MNRQVSLLDSRPLNRNERRKQRTRQELKEATAALLIEKGYDSLTIQDITDHADYARATFYIHFKDKEEAVWAMLEDSFTELMPLLWDSEESDPRRQRYLKWVRLFDYLAKNRELLTALVGERGHIKIWQRLVDFMAATLAQDLADGRVERSTELPVPFEAHFYAGGLMQIMTWYLQTEPDYSGPELAAMLYAIVLRQPVPPEFL